MNITFISLVSGALLAAAMPAVQAATVSYSFTVAVDSGSLVGQSFIGNFSFDDAQTPTPGIGGEDLFALASFNFGFSGSLSLADLDYGDATFLGGQFLGLEAGGATFSFLPATGPFSAPFAYDLGNGQAGNGSVTYTPRVGTVPEPPTLWLALGLLGGLAGVRRFTARR